MPLPVIADVFRVTFNWTPPIGVEGSAHNVMHFSAPAMDSEALAGVIDSDMVDGVFAALSAGAIVNTIDVLPLDGTSASTEWPMTGAWRDGAGGADTAPATCAIVKLRTGLRGRSNRGRIYLPYVAESEQTGGKLVDATRDTMTAAWVASLNALVADDVALGVASYVGAGAWHQVINTAVEGDLGTQRRRQQRH